MYEDVLSNIDKSIERLNSMREVVTALPELPNVAFANAHEYWLIVSFPYQSEAINENRKRMEDAGFTYKRDDRTDDGKYYQDYQSKDGKEVTLIYNPTLDGSTCARNIIGYRQEPIYEVVCSEAQS